MVRTFVQPTTRAQREAVFRKFQQDFPSWVSPGRRKAITEYEKDRWDTLRVPTLQYRRFRRKFRNYGDYIGGEWKGMFLGIEKDGYAHS